MRCTTWVICPCLLYAFQESPDTAHIDPSQDEGGKTRQDSDESEQQSDSSTTEPDKSEGETAEDKNEIQCAQEKKSQMMRA